ncbi:MAG: sporulation protein YqfD [Oscillospiraceae bacterium]|nr:sporulation protein YqfD [Oscillospiraceae bacterium]
MLVSLFRYLRGYIRCSAEGVFTERFLNLLIQNGITVWDVEKSGYTMSCCVFASDYKKLGKYAERTQVRLSSAEKHGAPFFIKENRRRSGIMVGAVLFITFLSVMNSFIWHIEVVGNETVSDELILSTAEKLGLHTGIKASSIDAESFERLLFLELEPLSWVAVNVEESTVIINVKESDPKPIMYPENDLPYNIVAARDGVIRRIVCSVGNELVTEGSIVKAGDLIVSGILGYTDGRWDWKHARAKVYAETEYAIMIDIPLKQTVEKATGEHIIQTTVELFDTEFPRFAKPYEGTAYEFRSKESVKFLWFDLPLKRVVYDYMVYENIPVEYSEAQAKALALDELELRKSAELGDAQILDSKITGFVKNGVFRLKAEYTCIMDIAKEQGFSISDTKQKNIQQ